MQQNNITTSNAPTALASPQKQSHGMLIGLIAAIVIAVVGLGTSVAAFTMKAADAADYEEQIAVLENAVEEAEENAGQPEPLIVTTPAGEEVTTTAPGNVDASQYIYIGQWDIKIKIPENLLITKYDYAMYNGFSAVEILGSTKDGQYLPGFADPSENRTMPLGAVNRFPKDAEQASTLGRTIVFTDDQYVYSYAGPQALYSDSESEQKWEVESVQAIQQMLEDPENYSTI